MKNKSILYSQNFIQSSELVETLLKKTNISSKDTVCEIGTGEGKITEILSKKCSKVISYEKDKTLYIKLKKKFEKTKNIEIHNKDFLEEEIDLKNMKIFSNIPFNITSDILKKIFESKNPPTDSYIFIQKEASEKYSGEPKETMISLLIKPWFELKEIHTFNPRDFNPIPSVNIVLLHIKKREESLIENKYKKTYHNFITYTFTQWQPNIKKTYDGIFTYKQIKQLSKELKFDLKNQISNLKFEQYKNIFEFFLRNVDDLKKKKILNSSEKLKKQQEKLKKIKCSRTNKRWKKLTTN